MPDKKSNNTNTYIGLGIFIAAIIIVVIIIIIMTKAILPSDNSKGSAAAGTVNSNLGIHTDTTTQPPSTSSVSSSVLTSSDDDDDGYSSPTGTVMTVNGDVNVRSGPGSDYDLLGEIKAGESVTVYEEDAKWYRISYAGSSQAYIYSGYVNGSLPSAASVTTSDTTTSYSIDDYSGASYDNYFSAD